MAYRSTGLALIAHGLGNQMFHYVTADEIGEVMSENYFDDAIDDVGLARGDIIFATVNNKWLPELAILLVTDDADGCIKVAMSL
ncbi:MAG: hypothetical protein GY804_03590 [Alphaproteobacteria bacterium]|nr:hypothetical protein [Alphaproteobacteria bacterium]